MSGPAVEYSGKLTASDAAFQAQFGISVAVSGNAALVGARNDFSFDSGSGSAYVFVRSGTTWTQQQKLGASDAERDRHFGTSVALSGDTAMIGVPNDHDAGFFSGSAYVFVRSGSNWTQQQKLSASDAAAATLFGFSVAVSGDTALVGAQSDDDLFPNSGSAYVFICGGTNWTQRQKLRASDLFSGDQFGWSVALSGDTALVGAIGKNSAYVYALPIAGFDIFGTGCSGTVGVPSLEAVSGQLPWIDQTFTVELCGIPTGVASVPFGVLGLSKTASGQFSLPLDLSPFGIWNCTQYVSLDFVTTIGNNGGTATWDIPIPFNPHLIGLPFYVQGAVLDFGVNPAHIIVTNAGEGVIGGW